MVIGHFNNCFDPFPGILLDQVLFPIDITGNSSDRNSRRFGDIWNGNLFMVHMMCLGRFGYITSNAIVKITLICTWNSHALLTLFWKYYRILLFKLSSKYGKHLLVSEVLCVVHKWKRFQIVKCHEMGRNMWNISCNCQDYVIDLWKMIVQNKKIDKNKENRWKHFHNRI